VTIDRCPNKDVTLVYELAGIRPLHSICDILVLARVEGVSWPPAIISCI